MKCIILTTCAAILPVWLMQCPACDISCESQAVAIIEEMEKAYDPALRRGDRGELEKLINQLASLGGEAIGPTVDYYRCHTRMGTPTNGERGFVAVEAIKSLGRINDKRAISELFRFARGESSEISLLSIVSLRRLCFEDQLDQIVGLVAALPPKWETHRVMLLELLGRFGGKGVQELIRRYLSDPDPTIRRGALRAVARSANGCYLPVVQSILAKDQDPHVRVAAAEAASKLGDEAGTRYLLQELDPQAAPDQILRAMCPLVRLREPATVPKLAELLGHKEIWMREFAYDGLQAIRTPQALRVLRECGPVLHPDSEGGFWVRTQERYEEDGGPFDWY